MKAILSGLALAAVSSTASLVTSAAFADSCEQVGAAFSNDVLRLSQQAAQVDALWDQIADDSRASARAEDLKDSTRNFHGVMFRKDCDDLVEDFDDIKDDSRALHEAVADDPQLARRRDINAALLKLRQILLIVERRVAPLR